MQTGGSYFTNNDTFRNLFDSGNWQDAIRQLGFINLDNIANFNSPLYQQYASYLQKTTPGVGVNSLLAPLMAGGVSYAGGQNIATARANEMNRGRQDKVNAGVQGFALNMQNQILPQLSQIGGSFESQRNFNLQQQQTDAANSPWNQIGSTLGGLAGMFLPGLIGMGGGMAGAAGGGGASAAVGGYGG